MSDLPTIILLSTGEAVPISALEFSTSRSGGPGGQNVNKVETRVEVRFAVTRAEWLAEETRARLVEVLARRLDASGRIRVVARSERTQRGNRIAAIDRLGRILNNALRRDPLRTPTRPTSASRVRRLEAKKRHGEKKSGRRWTPE